MLTLTSANGQKFVTPYTFQCAPDGNDPNGVIAGGDGTIYGTTYGGGTADLGTIYEITPPTVKSAWKESVIHSFVGGADGSHPSSKLVRAATGSLYGTTISGGNSNMGVVFELKPPVKPGAGWTETIIHTFQGGLDGANSYSALLQGNNGDLFGVTASGGYPGNSGYGTIFQLIPPSGPATDWTEHILYAFQPNDIGKNPTNGIVFGTGGSIFGSTEIVFGANGPVTYGSLYKLSPPLSSGGDWVMSFLYSFSGGEDGGAPEGTLTPAPGGKLFGTGAVGGASNTGVAYVLMPPPSGQSTWGYNKILDFPASFGGPVGGLLLETTGVLVGFSYVGGLQNQGTVFALVPPAGARPEWKLESLGNLTPSTGVNPGTGPTARSNNSVYGAGVATGLSCGTVFIDYY